LQAKFYKVELSTGIRWELTPGIPQGSLVGIYELNCAPSSEVVQFEHKRTARQIAPFPLLNSEHGSGSSLLGLSDAAQIDEVALMMGD
jgi:hypothetical protein